MNDLKDKNELPKSNHRVLFVIFVLLIILFFAFISIIDTFSFSTNENDLVSDTSINTTNVSYKRSIYSTSDYMEYNLNYVPYSSVSSSSNYGITYINNFDGSFTLNGTSTARSQFRISSSYQLKANTTYTFFLKDISPVFGVACFLQLNYSSGSTFIDLVGNSVSLLVFTTSSNVDFIFSFDVRYADISIDNLVIFPCLYEGSYSRDNLPFVQPNLEYIYNQGYENGTNDTTTFLNYTNYFAPKLQSYSSNGLNFIFKESSISVNGTMTSNGFRFSFPLLNNLSSGKYWVKTFNVPSNFIWALGSSSDSTIFYSSSGTNPSTFELSSTINSLDLIIYSGSKNINFDFTLEIIFTISDSSSYLFKPFDYDLFNSAYNQGYNQGYNEGYDKGYNEGFNEGAGVSNSPSSFLSNTNNIKIGYANVGSSLNSVPTLNTSISYYYDGTYTDLSSNSSFITTKDSLSLTSSTAELWGGNRPNTSSGGTTYFMWQFNYDTFIDISTFDSQFSFTDLTKQVNSSGITYFNVYYYFVFEDNSITITNGSTSQILSDYSSDTSSNLKQLTIMYSYSNSYNLVPFYVYLLSSINLPYSASDTAYSLGYENGFQQGYNQGLNDNSYGDLQYQNGYNSGYDSGYNQGTIDGSNGGKLFVTTLNTILNAPFEFAKQALNFDLFGINLLDIGLGLLTLSILVFIIKKLF